MIVASSQPTFSIEAIEDELDLFGLWGECVVVGGGGREGPCGHHERVVGLEVLVTIRQLCRARCLVLTPRKVDFQGARARRRKLEGEKGWIMPKGDAPDEHTR